jgi:NADH-quinone oxidoreductase subunit F
MSEAGLWKRPTDVQNVETLAAIPKILREGGAWYRALGDEKSSGTKLFCLSGHINRPGLYEVPLGMTLRHVIEDLGGGIPGGRTLKAVLPAGSASPMLYPPQLDLNLDYPSVSQAGSFLGSASLIVMDDSVCMVDMAYWMSGFYHHESCGQCTPCRDGTEDIHEVLQKIVMGDGEMSHLDYVKSLGDYMRTASICGLGTSAPNIPVSSILHFEEEWKEHVLGKKCRAGVCPMTRTKVVDFPVRRSRGLVAGMPEFQIHEP